MKSSFFYPAAYLISIAAAVLLFPQSSPGKTEEREIDIPVRVFRDGRAISKLNAGDFTVTVNGINRSGIRLVQPGVSQVQQRDPGHPLTHILVFHLFRATPGEQRHLNDILGLLIQPNDRLWYLLPTRIVLVDRIDSSEEAVLITEALIPDELKTAEAQTVAERDNLRQFMDRLREQSFRVVDRNGPIDDGEYTGIHLHYYMKALKSSLETYVQMKRTYEKRYLFPRGERVQSLLPHAVPSPVVHLFYQPPALPELSRNNRRMIRHWIRELGDSDWYDEQEYAQLIYQVLGEIDSAFSWGNSDGPRPPVRPFVEAGAPLFPIILEPAAVQADTATRSGWWPKLVKMWQDAASSSGGRCTTLAETAADIRDHGCGLNFHYLLRLTLTGGEDLQSLKIEAKDRGARVFHPAADAVARSARTAVWKNPPQTVRIEEAAFRNRELTLVLRPSETGGGPSDPVLVRIRVRHGPGRWVFDQSKSLTPQGDRVRARIRFTRLPPGSYAFFIETRLATSTISTLRLIRGVIAP